MILRAGMKTIEELESSRCTGCIFENEVSTICDADACHGVIFVSGSTQEIPTAITLRERFTGMAMQGFLSNPSIDILEPHEVAHDAILYADALITELERTK